MNDRNLGTPELLAPPVPREAKLILDSVGLEQEFIRFRTIYEKNCRLHALSLCRFCLESELDKTQLSDQEKTLLKEVLFSNPVDGLIDEIFQYDHKKKEEKKAKRQVIFTQINNLCRRITTTILTNKAKEVSCLQFNYFCREQIEIAICRIFDLNEHKDEVARLIYEYYGLNHTKGNGFLLGLYQAWRRDIGLITRNSLLDIFQDKKMDYESDIPHLGVLSNRSPYPVINKSLIRDLVKTEAGDSEYLLEEKKVSKWWVIYKLAEKLANTDRELVQNYCASQILEENPMEISDEITALIEKIENDEDFQYRSDKYTRFIKKCYDKDKKKQQEKTDFLEDQVRELATLLNLNSILDLSSLNFRTLEMALATIEDTIICDTESFEKVKSSLHILALFFSIHKTLCAYKHKTSTNITNVLIKRFYLNPSIFYKHDNKKFKFANNHRLEIKFTPAKSYLSTALKYLTKLDTETFFKADADHKDFLFDTTRLTICAPDDYFRSEETVRNLLRQTMPTLCQIFGTEILKDRCKIRLKGDESDNPKSTGDRRSVQMTFSFRVDNRTEFVEVQFEPMSNGVDHEERVRYESNKVKLAQENLGINLSFVDYFMQLAFNFIAKDDLDSLDTVASVQNMTKDNCDSVISNNRLMCALELANIINGPDWNAINLALPNSSSISSTAEANIPAIKIQRELDDDLTAVVNDLHPNFEAMKRRLTEAIVRLRQNR